MNNARGYSLLEVMISMVVLAIAFLALIATQLGSLNGYVSARDTLQAGELGRRTAELLQIQGSQWTNNQSTGIPMTLDTFVPTEPYDPSDATPFDRDNPVADIVGAGGAWVALVDTPIDTRFNRVNTDISTDHLGGKYCVYARGAEMAPTFADFSTGAGTMSSMRFQIAVVYPGPRAVLTNCQIGVTITAAELDNVGNPTADPFVPPALESRGYRVSYFGTILVRRAHLAQN